jgi:hypothetical protein
VKNAVPPYQGLDSDDLWFYPVVSLKVSSDYDFLYVTVLPELHKPAGSGKAADY